MTVAAVLRFWRSGQHVINLRHGSLAKVGLLRKVHLSSSLVGSTQPKKKSFQTDWHKVSVKAKFPQRGKAKKVHIAARVIRSWCPNTSGLLLISPPSN